jgi:hypothetical protein
MNTLRFVACFAVLVSILASPAFAGGGAGRHALTVGGGVSSPSGVNSLLGENPAGLVYNQRFSLFGEGFTQGDGLDNIGFGGHVLMGASGVGAGVGMRSYDGGNSRSNQLDFGLGAYANPLKTAIGVNGTYDLDGGGTNFNVGMIFDPMGQFRVGAVIYGVSGGIDEVGAGIAYDINPDATLSVDASSTTELEGLSFKPALGVNVQQVQLTVGYGFSIDDAQSTRMDTGFSAGAGIFIGRALHLQYYYQQLVATTHELGLKYSF